MVKDTFNWKYLKKNYDKASLIRGDVRNFKSILQASRNADVIIHAAAQVAVTISERDPRADFEMNALGTFNVLEAARRNDSSVVYCSTNKVYGDNINRIAIRESEKRYYFLDEKFKNGITEDFPVDLCSHSPYGCSKLTGDLYAQDYASTYGLKTGIFRMSCIYGERQFGVEDQGWVSWFVIATLTRRPVTIYGDGKQVRDLLYVNDLVDGYDAFVKSKLKHGVFNIGGGPLNTVSILEFLDVLEELTGKKPKTSFADWRPADQKIYVSCISKIGEKLNWQPKVNFRKGIERVVNWVNQNVESMLSLI